VKICPEESIRELILSSHLKSYSNTAWYRSAAGSFLGHMHPTMHWTHQSFSRTP